MPECENGRERKQGARSSDPVASYWDENRGKSGDPAFWMAHPLCRAAINRRVTGSPDEWPLDWFARTLEGARFQRGLSWGCGLGAFERSALRAGIVRAIDAFDISEASLEDARRAAHAEGIDALRYARGSFDDPKLEPGRYDIVFFHASLHHVSRLERLFRRLAAALKPGAAIYVDEYVGPSRHDWSDDEMRLARAVLEMVPDTAKLQKTIPYPIQPDDPSEAVRSSEIPRFVRQFFHVIDWRPYGGQLVDLVMPCLADGWALSPEGRRYVAAMLEIEEAELSRDRSRTHHVVAYGRLKSDSPPGAAARLLRSRMRRLMAHARTAANAESETAEPAKNPGGE